MKTLYRPVPGFSNLYAGTDGSIINGAGAGKLKQSRARGYLRVWVPELKKNRPAHCLIAAAFLGPCPPGMEVRHGDGVRSNNNIGNLCYGTTRDNAQDAMRHGTHQGAVNRGKTHCPRNHEYSPENTYTNPNTGRRNCRTCQGAQRAEFAARYGRSKSGSK